MVTEVADGWNTFSTAGEVDFKQLDEWPHWLKRFEQFQIASGLNAESPERQVKHTALLPR